MESLKQRIINQLSVLKNELKEQIEAIAKDRSFKAFKKQLIEDKIVTEEEILWIFSKEYGIPYLDIRRYSVPKENARLLPKEIAMRYSVLPLSNMKEVLTLATADPLDVLALDNVGVSVSFKKIDLVLAKEEYILQALKKLYFSKATEELFSQDKSQIVLEQKDYQEEVDLAQAIKESNLAPIVKIVNLIIFEGLNKKASDIHLEPTESELVVRYRIDGVLLKGLTLPKENQSAIIARLKIMSSLNITEFRIPQDGRFKVKFQERMIDFRVSSLPTQFGEKFVLRILDREKLSVGIEKLGFSKVPAELFAQALKAPFGIILVTGPTGSGKSTTLYSVLAKRNKPDTNIITIEDPVEYQLEGITQIQVKPEIGLNFSTSLRSVLRQSPDIVMVGEIRDSQTADIAIKASLTGEFIFSTLHTNNAVGALTRLMDMGVEPFLLSSSLIAATAQRLVREICRYCKEKYLVDKKILQKTGFKEPPEYLYKGQGCKKCNSTGYSGRIALLEVLLIDGTIREMILERKSEEKIIEYARKNCGFLSLKEDGFLKCQEGITTIEEVLRVAG